MRSPSASDQHPAIKAFGDGEYTEEHSGWSKFIEIGRWKWWGVYERRITLFRHVGNMWRREGTWNRAVCTPWQGFLVRVQVPYEERCERRGEQCESKNRDELGETWDLSTQTRQTVDVYGYSQ